LVQVQVQEEEEEEDEEKDWGRSERPLLRYPGGAMANTA
jgi:hypothetical protein